jgi:mono/diheme cytochrome c family protein
MKIFPHTTTNGFVMRNSIQRMTPLLIYASLALAVGGCQNTSPAHSSAKNAAESTRRVHAAQKVDPLDSRIPVPLLPRMAAHQRENMRDHLAAVQEILAAVSAGDFAGVEKSAARIGYSEEMGQMCAHMGAGAPGFNELALNFHHTADTIVPAAKTRDTAATLKAVSATLQTCAGCHAVYRQQIVNEAMWERIVSDVEKTNRLQPGKP